MRKSLTSPGWWAGFFVFLVMIWGGSLFAAEGSARLTFQKTVPIDKRATYTVKKGDTINRIIRSLGIAAPSLKALKKLNPDISNFYRLHPGQNLIIADEEEQKSLGSPEDFRDYTVKRGDSLIKVILSELKVPRKDVVMIIRYVWTVNTEMDNVNKIYPGQILKLPGERSAGDEKKESPEGPAAVGEKEESPASVTTPPPTEDRKQTASIVLPPAKTLAIIDRIVKQLNGAMITTGNYYIPLPESGQVVIDCEAIPVAELDDGTTVLLDFAGRLPDELAAMIQSNWSDYHLLKLENGESVASILQKMILQSKSYTMIAMAQAGKPLFIEDEPQVKLWPDWVISKKAPPEKPAPQLGLFFASDAKERLPRPVVAYAKKKGVNICEIIADTVPPDGEEAPAEAASITVPRIPGNNNDELLQNFFTFLGLEAESGREVKIFDAIKDGFTLSIKADWLVKRGNKTVLIHKNKLPRQFTEILRNAGMEPVYLARGISKKSLLEGALPALGIPAQFAFFSMPAAEKKAKFALSFSALKITRGEAQFYLTDFDMDRDLYELLTNYWKVNILRY